MQNERANTEITSQEGAEPKSQQSLDAFSIKFRERRTYCTIATGTRRWRRSFRARGRRRRRLVGRRGRWWWRTLVISSLLLLLLSGGGLLVVLVVGHIVLVSPIGSVRVGGSIVLGVGAVVGTTGG